MAYEATQWVNGQTITVAGLNKLEQAVGEMNMSYSPHTWTDGEALTASKMNALEQAVASSSGGSTWTTLYDGSVTTVDEGGTVWGIIPNISAITADSIKVTFNGVEYTCEKNEIDGYGASYDEATDSYTDYSIYPFFIAETELYTETAGTYNLKIEAQQSSGGSSDFSTANITFNSSLMDDYEVVVPFCDDPSGLSSNVQVYAGDDPFTLQVPIYKNGPTYLISNQSLTISGSIEGGGDMILFGLTFKIYAVTGDCTITIVADNDFSIQ